MKLTEQSNPIIVIITHKLTCVRLGGGGGGGKSSATILKRAMNNIAECDSERQRCHVAEKVRYVILIWSVIILQYHR